MMSGKYKKKHDGGGGILTTAANILRGEGRKRLV